MSSVLRQDEAGFALVEVVVTALLVAIIAVGVLNGIDSASLSTGRSKDRNAATSLAQQDQERIRAMPYTQLASLNQTRHVQSCDETGGTCVTYTVQTASQLVQAGSGTANCTSASTVPYDLHVTTTVSWPGLNASSSVAQPVTMDSLVTPPVGGAAIGQGGLTVLVTKADGTTPQTGITVNVQGATPASQTTDASGCAVWSSLPVGQYTVELNQAGYSDPNGNQDTTKTINVAGGQWSSTNFLYDQVANVAVNFQASGGGGAQSDRVTFIKSGNPDQSFGVAGSFASSINVTNVLPGTYTYYAGDCSGEKPGGTLPSVTLGAGTNTPLTLSLPPIKVNVKNNGAYYAAPDPNAPNVKVTPTTTGCANTGSFSQQTNGSGALPSPGFPYGTYSVCADAPVVGNGTHHQSLGTATLSTTTGATLTAQTITKQDPLGPCP